METLAALRSARWQSLIASQVGQAWSGAARDRLGILVSAGPSLARNGDLLCDDRFLHRRIIVASIDCMGALERLHVQPDIVVACEPPRLEDADAARELGCPVIAFGEAVGSEAIADCSLAVHCDAGRMDETSVAHLVLRHLGCNPVVLVGVDLAFIDGLGHAPGHALDHAWALETNPFRSWDWLHSKRIAMRQGGLIREPDRGGRTVLMDGMLHRERAALEAAFDEDRRAGLSVIDATEGGCTKRHTDQMSLGEAMESFANRKVNALPAVVCDPVQRPTQTTVRVQEQRCRAIAVVPMDPQRGGTGVERSLEARLGERTVLHGTLQRLLGSKKIDRVVVIAPQAWDASVAFDGLPRSDRLSLMPWNGVPMPGDARVRCTARAWADSCWRGGLGGRSVFDEVLAPQAIEAAMDLHDATEAFLCGGDWPLVAVHEPWGADAMIQRVTELPQRPWMQFAQGPAGSSGCLLSRKAVAELKSGTVPCIGAWLDERMDWSRRPERLRVSPSIAMMRERVIMDTPRAMRRLRRALEPLMRTGYELSLDHALTAVARQAGAAPTLAPQHLMIELNTGRRGCGLASPHRFGSLQRPIMTAKRLDRVLNRIAEARDVVVSFAGAGDPLIHPELPAFIQRVREAGALALELRTELLSPHAVNQLQDLDADVISVDLHAIDDTGYRLMMGSGDFQRSVQHVQDLIDRSCRNRQTGTRPCPWIVPRIERMRESVSWVPAFVDTWQKRADGAIVDPPPQNDPWGMPLDDAPLRARSDDVWACRNEQSGMSILSDGRVPVIDGDLLGQSSIGSVDHEDLVILYRTVMAQRRSAESGATFAKSHS